MDRDILTGQGANAALTSIEAVSEVQGQYLLPPAPEYFYQKMFLIRSFEELVLSLFSNGELAGTTHACIGQEAIAVGVLSQIGPNDVIFSNHRCHGHYLVYSDDVEGLLAEIMGRRTGICGGKGGSQHLYARNFYSNGILGGTVPCAAGMALAEKLKGSGAKAIVFLGDGALGEGVVYETFNLSALWALPILFVIENNFYAQSTPSALQIAGSIAERPQAFNIPTVHASPATVEEIYDLAAVALRSIEHEGRPYCLVFDTYRFCPHSKSDDFRPADEIARWRENDPLRRLATRLEPAVRETIEAQLSRRIEGALTAARLAAFPDADSLNW